MECITQLTPFKVVATFVSATGAIADPGTVRAYVRPPGSSAPTLYTYLTDTELSRITTGIYQVLCAGDLPGDWYILFVGTGAVGVSLEKHVRIQPAAALVGV